MVIALGYVVALLLSAHDLHEQQLFYATPYQPGEKALCNAANDKLNRTDLSSDEWITCTIELKESDKWAYQVQYPAPNVSESNSVAGVFSIEDIRKQP